MRACSEVRCCSVKVDSRFLHSVWARKRKSISHRSKKKRPHHQLPLHLQFRRHTLPHGLRFSVVLKMPDGQLDCRSGHDVPIGWRLDTFSRRYDDEAAHAAATTLNSVFWFDGPWTLCSLLHSTSCATNSSRFRTVHSDNSRAENN